jgi:hypothetical protein
METDKNSRSKTATLWARPPQTKAAPMAKLPFRNAGISPALLRATSGRPRTFSTKFLIANPRLEFSATPTKQTSESKPNRKKFAIFHPAFSLETRPQPIAQFLIETPRLEFSVTPTKETTSQFLIDTKSGICIPNSFSRSLDSVRAQGHKSKPPLHAPLPCVRNASMVIFNSIEI